MNGLKEHYPHVLENIEMRKWEVLTEVPGEYNETLVKEYYAAYATSRNAEQKRNHVFLKSVVVRGVEILCDSISINDS